VIAVSVGVSVFLTVLVIAVAFIAWYRMKINLRKGEITRREGSVEGTVDQPTAVDNPMDGMELDALHEHRNGDSETPRSDANAGSEDNDGVGPREGVV
jgi:hypothetical protein